MSPNPEQFSIPNPKNTSTAGENPTTAGHLEDIPFDKEPLELHYGEDEKQKVDTGQLAQVQTGEYRSPRPPAKELPVEAEKKSKVGRWVAAGVGAVALLAASTVITVNSITGNGFIKNPNDKENLPPAPDTTNTAPVTPGQTAPTETKIPVPENRGGLGTDTYKFFSPDGKNFQTFEQLSDSITIPVGENADSIEAQTTYYKQMEKMANYFPSEQEVRNNLNIPTGQLTVDDYMDACALYHKAYDKLYDQPSGGLHDFMKELAAKVAFIKLETLNNSEAVPYNVTIDFAKTKPEFTITDNAAQNSIDDVNPISGTYELTFTGGGPNKTTGENPVWLVDGNVHVAKADAAK